ncbi:uncharacterized protein LOC129588850 [Paramacrobiotus metropolitanus]|uniref:uncharacterized protein LOC129588850 n=1 Tax=Paramacrobiotus metropolitanus TaxID=2943436 RepID=UPI002446063D|nr:uncharacterized protein LOC129588850 [Paramacrobiotus metropolitanus]
MASKAAALWIVLFLLIHCARFTVQDGISANCICPVASCAPCPLNSFAAAANPASAVFVALFPWDGREQEFPIESKDEEAHFKKLWGKDPAIIKTFLIRFLIVTLTLYTYVILCTFMLLLSIDTIIYNRLHG